ncbi:hypothetical protein [Xanthocytophaga flava]|uniref:hypothetical protein n=1 Tax=Xanthocytophaga flava TaxID=3048013 RepID=UPI0028D6520E|nr:hypothetical protein [Xanthocytophaga flavus]MDJ1473543.1 hypothetical protein [Xanthocytophaga flavus]
MDQVKSSQIARQRITKQYQWAMYSYLAPVVLFVLYLIDANIFGLTKMFFFAISLMSLIPSACVGLFFTVRGVVMVFKTNDYQKKDIGYANLLMGIIMAFAGVIAVGFLYVMVN